MVSRPKLERIIHYNDDAQAIAGHIQEISWSIESFMVSLLPIVVA
jgi:hypothetical protein